MTIADPKAILRTLPTKPGVYRMLNDAGTVLYVGKARDLKKRVSSYFRTSGLAPRTALLMRETVDIEVTLTHTENEALILENNLIKSLKPRFNILLRDDKSYPYIYVSTTSEYPRIEFHRGPRKHPGRYFGPYPSAGAVRASLNLLQKTFGVRQCKDSFFKGRTRACLQYQIRRCSGPCIGAVTPERYAEDVTDTIAFLEGRCTGLISELVVRMDEAAQGLDYELAAMLRDRISALKQVQATQAVDGAEGDLDVIAVARSGVLGCVHVSTIRDGRLLGSRAYFPASHSGTAANKDAHTAADDGEILSAFISQYYVDKPVPSRILLSQRTTDGALLDAALSQQAGHAVRIHVPARGALTRLVALAQDNAEEALRRELLTKSSLRERFEALAEALGLDVVPARIECFDISHTRGEATVGACVVFGEEGPLKSDYRRFNIEDITPGDDYAAMRQTLMRRYKRLAEGEGKWPDLVLIDGGKGQLAEAEAVFEELGLEGITLMGVAKGVARRAGEERLFLSSTGEGSILPHNSRALHLIQQVRDEAHRFAISGHRGRRARSRTSSPLESVPGIGAKRRQSLLKHLGGMQEVARAGIEDLARVPGISRALAKEIYDAFHES